MYCMFLQYQNLCIDKAKQHMCIAKIYNHYRESTTGSSMKGCNTLINKRYSMKHSPLCRLISTSQWHSLSLYLSRRQTHSRTVRSYAADTTNSTTYKAKRPDNKAGVAVAAEINHSQSSNTNANDIRASDTVAKVPSANNKDPRRTGRQTGKQNYEAREGDRRHDNGRRKGGTGSTHEMIARSTPDRSSTSAADALVIRRLAGIGLGDGIDKAKRKREEHDVYRPLRRRSGAGDIRSQVKAELDSSRSRSSGRPSGSSSHRESRSLLDEVFPSDDSQARASWTGDNEQAEMPRLKLEHLMKDEEYKAPTGEQSEEEKLRKFYKAERENLGKEKGILLLRGLGPSLEEEDFRRLSPKGKHIEDWEHELGNILKGRVWSTFVILRSKSYQHGGL